jgi:hypothetical protein
LIGLTLNAATAMAETQGVDRIRVIEVADRVMIGAIDMMLAPDRLDLFHQDGRVAFAMFP